ncbi:hypothetical protein ES705_36411 [subsurface metagenome]
MMAKKFIHSDEDWEEIQREVYEHEQMMVAHGKSMRRARGYECGLCVTVMCAGCSMESED